jgi:6-phosphogluconate dehydrogenase
VVNKVVGLCGLGEMGKNLALNLQDHDYSVVGYDPSLEARDIFQNSVGHVVFNDLVEFILALPTPRVIFLMMPSTVVEEFAGNLCELICSGDIVVDAGNSNFEITEILWRRFKSQKKEWVGIGFSGGVQGARYGGSVMAGGSQTAVAKLTPLFESVTAQATDKSPCFTYVGEAGAGHFAKMVHNGIEYADMQAIAEVTFMLRHLLHMTSLEIATTFDGWCHGELESYLLETSARVLAEEAEDTLPLVDKIVDQASDKGTGRWLISSATSLGVEVPSIASAVFARFQSSSLERRLLLKSQKEPFPLPNEKDDLISSLHDALIGSRIVAFAQGLTVLKAASLEYDWNYSQVSLLKSWRNGCIIRGRLLNTLIDDMTPLSTECDILALPAIAGRLQNAGLAWRSAVSTGIERSIPIPVLTAGLQWLDAFKVGRLWTDLIQGQRDYFGAHGFSREDRIGVYKHDWKRK